MKLADYRCLVFDCDGVVLDSNRIKTEAFREVAMAYGPDAAQALVEYHVRHGGMSRFLKFRYLLDEIVPAGTPGPDHDALLAGYAAAVRDGLMRCAIVDGLETLRRAMPGVPWLIVSGGAQEELREIFAARGIDRHFDRGIFGSPDTKDEILAREIAFGTIPAPALFIGDSAYDHAAATRAGLDFVFASYWTELPDWQGFVAEHKLRRIEALSMLDAA
jgi:phosphoglycolate phosphatase-like HAD superfamily hydrolase